MADQGTLQEFQKIDFFRDIPASYLEKLVELSRPVEYPAHTTIFEEYGEAKDVYVIASGEVSLAICEPDISCRQIATVKGGDMMGWSPMVGRARLADTAVTLSPVRAFLFDGDQLLDFCRAHPEFGFEFMHRVACALSDRLSGTRIQLLKMCGFDLPKVQVETD